MKENINLGEEIVRMKEGIIEKNFLKKKIINLKTIIILDIKIENIENVQDRMIEIIDEILLYNN